MEKFIKGTLIFAVLLHVAVCGGEGILMQIYSIIY